MILLVLAGVLVLVINYTGDRIHFGLAVERARREGIKVGASSLPISNNKDFQCFCLHDFSFSTNLE